MNTSTHDQLKTFVANMEDHLARVENLAQQMQQLVLDTEGDSDLNRKLACYLLPALRHWVLGAQAGNMRDLQETLARRENTSVFPQPAGKSGDGFEVM